MAAASASAAAPARTERQQSVLDAAKSAAAAKQRQLDAAGVQPVKPTPDADGTIKSKVRGICWDKCFKRWRCQLGVDGVAIFLVRSQVSQ
jgi:hypothetical protein